MHSCPRNPVVCCSLTSIASHMKDTVCFQSEVGNHVFREDSMSIVTHSGRRQQCCQSRKPMFCFWSSLPCHLQSVVNSELIEERARRLVILSHPFLFEKLTKPNRSSLLITTVSNSDARMIPQLMLRVGGLTWHVTVGMFLVQV